MEVVEFLKHFPALLLSALNNVPGETWGVLTETIVSAVVVSPLMLAIKNWWNIDNEKKMLMLVILGSMLAGAIDYLHSKPEFMPWFALVQGWLVFGTTQPVYRFFVKPLFAKLSTRLAEQLTKATSVSEARAATIPPQGLPLNSTPSSPDDFSH